jgi:hypothetical protein
MPSYFPMSNAVMTAKGGLYEEGLSHPYRRGGFAELAGIVGAVT